jgi:hypothetical protein
MNHQTNVEKKHIRFDAQLDDGVRTEIMLTDPTKIFRGDYSHFVLSSTD